MTLTASDFSHSHQHALNRITGAASDANSYVRGEELARQFAEFVRQIRIPTELADNRNVSVIGGALSPPTRMSLGLIASESRGNRVSCGSKQQTLAERVGFGLWRVFSMTNMPGW